MYQHHRYLLSATSFKRVQPPTITTTMMYEAARTVRNGRPKINHACAHRLIKLQLVETPKLISYRTIGDCSIESELPCRSMIRHRTSHFTAISSARISLRAPAESSRSAQSLVIATDGASLTTNTLLIKVLFDRQAGVRQRADLWRFRGRCRSCSSLSHSVISSSSEAVFDLAANYTSVGT